MRLPAPAIAAATSPKSVGIVREAKTNVARVISIVRLINLIKSAIA